MNFDVAQEAEFVPPYPGLPVAQVIDRVGDFPTPDKEGYPNEQGR